jgi:hypothetical protein
MKYGELFLKAIKKDFFFLDGNYIMRNRWKGNLMNLTFPSNIFLLVENYDFFLKFYNMR